MEGASRTQLREVEAAETGLSPLGRGSHGLYGNKLGSPVALARGGAKRLEEGPSREARRRG